MTTTEDSADCRLATYALTTVDGDLMTVTYAQFCEANECGSDEDGHWPEIAGLDIGQTYAGGGGAQPEWSIRRIA